jgi:hypothetical protein
MLRPTASAIDFMHDYVERLMVSRVWQWEQTAWNEVILAYLWGSRDTAPLKYRLLPATDFMEIHMFKARRDAGLAIHPIVLHPAGIHGDDKKRAYEELQMWRPDFNSSSSPEYSRYQSGDAEKERIQALARYQQNTHMFGRTITQESFLWIGMVPLLVGIFAATAIMVTRRNGLMQAVETLKQKVIGIAPSTNSAE